MVFAASKTERALELADILQELVRQGYLDQALAEHCLHKRPLTDGKQAQHPLEVIAAQQLDDLMRPGKKLDLETLGQWLADWAGQPYLRIDPLKIDVAAVTPLMSYAFALRHGILAVAQDVHS